MRLAGVHIPDDKRIEVALTYIYGIGSSNVLTVLAEAGLDPDKRTKDLVEEEINRLQQVISGIPTEGELRQRVRDDVQRLKTIDSYRGIRHKKNLPARGQRTRTNARTKRGGRQTVGAMKKQDRAKQKVKSGDKEDKGKK